MQEDLPKIDMFYEDLICTMKKMLKWLKLNSLNDIPGKFQVMILGDKTCYERILNVNLTCVQSSDDVALLGVIINKSLESFVCKAQYKPHALRRIRKFLNV